VSPIQARVHHATGPNQVWQLDFSEYEILLVSCLELAWPGSRQAGRCGDQGAVDVEEDAGSRLVLQIGSAFSAITSDDAGGPQVDLLPPNHFGGSSRVRPLGGGGPDQPGGEL